MNPLDSQIERLLRAAARARRKAEAGLPQVPQSAWLLVRREKEREPVFFGALAVLRRGLAVTCVLLAVTLGFTFMQIRKAKSDTLNLSETMVVAARGVSFP